MSNLKAIFFKYGIECPTPERVAAAKDFEIEAPARIGGVSVVGTLKVGAFTYLHNGFLHNVEIGRYCSIGQNLTCLQPNHPLSWVSTHPFQYNGVDNIFGKELLEQLGININNHKKIPREPDRKTVIGNDVWIGRDVTMTHGVHVGDGAVVGACSVVTKNVPPYSIVAGNPAKHIRFRFEEDIIESLTAIKWWDYKIMDTDYSDYDQPSKFVDYIGLCIKNKSIEINKPVVLCKNDLIRENIDEN